MTNANAGLSDLNSSLHADVCALISVVSPRIPRVASLRMPDCARALRKSVQTSWRFDTAPGHVAIIFCDAPP